MPNLVIWIFVSLWCSLPIDLLSFVKADERYKATYILWNP
jgi:hypothetical protein